MKLEVITRAPTGQAHPTPLLFVHGAYSGAWVWDHHFLPFFAEHGFTAHALSLRGHGASEGWDTLQLARLGDYVADVAQVVASLPSPPVLIGHSMGGMVVQKYIQNHPLPGAVLLASVPPHGLFGSMMGMALTNPLLYREIARAQTLGPMTADSYIVRRALFSDEAPDAVVEHYLSRFQPESTLVILDLMGLDLPPSSPNLATPVMVLGAEDDMFVFRGAVEATAESYRVKAEILPRIAHAMMLDHSWQVVAYRILDWLRATLAKPEGEGDEPEASDRRPPLAAAGKGSG